MIDWYLVYLQVNWLFCHLCSAINISSKFLFTILHFLVLAVSFCFIISIFLLRFSICSSIMSIFLFISICCYNSYNSYFYFFPFIFISWRLITLQHCSDFCHTLTWISHGFTCIPHPNPPSHLPLHLIPLGLPSAPAPSTCLMYPTWAGDLFHPRWYTCFDAVLLKHPTLAFSNRVQKSVLYICVSFTVLHIGLSLPSF